MGFREYWYPGVWAKKVGHKKPVKVKMLEEDIVFFRGKDGNVVALTDWCPHRGARFSLGVCDFKGHHHLSISRLRLRRKRSIRRGAH